MGETCEPLLFCHCHIPRRGSKDSLAGYDGEEDDVGGTGTWGWGDGRQATCDAAAAKPTRRAKINSRGRINFLWLSGGLSNSSSFSVMDSLDHHSLFAARRRSSKQADHAEREAIFRRRKGKGRKRGRAIATLSAVTTCWISIIIKATVVLWCVWTWERRWKGGVGRRVF